MLLFRKYNKRKSSCILAKLRVVLLAHWRHTIQSNFNILIFGVFASILCVLAVDIHFSKVARASQNYFWWSPTFSSAIVQFGRGKWSGWGPLYREDVAAWRASLFLHANENCNILAMYGQPNCSRDIGWRSSSAFFRKWQMQNIFDRVV